MSSSRRACVIGSGPNGLAAAIVLAQAGLQVDVYEAAQTPGGASRTLELTLPGFLHDVGAAVQALGEASPFFQSVPLHEYGMQWVHPSAPVAHPLDDGTAVVLERDLHEAKATFGADGDAWIKLMGPLVKHWDEVAPDLLRPQPSIPKHPLLMASFGARAMLPASVLARAFRSERTRALFGGMAGHAILSLDEPLSGAFALLMSVTAHVDGWPIVRSGAQRLTDALCRHLQKLGGTVKTSARVDKLTDLPGYDLFLCDITPRQLLWIAGSRLSVAYKRSLARYRYGPGVFKVDYALRAAIPWKAKECLRAATVHLGGTFEEISEGEKAVMKGKHPERPLVLLVQASVFDPTRAPAGQHTVWAYCHVPHGSNFDMLPRLEAQIERFAPGFRDLVLARRVSAPKDLENMNANLIGGNITGGIMDVRQFLFRPTWRHYATSAPDIYICSSSTPPGGGVHGMCGYHAAKMALDRLTAE
ncbi:MAG: NAD(P)/FAD-dependent oxidoreductase [Acidobacteria bacterium]|nr:NAD(P)/FAD-dependent oxidoreductase [Acidobacteriota bacterium]